MSLQTLPFVRNADKSCAKCSTQTVKCDSASPRVTNTAVVQQPTPNSKAARSSRPAKQTSRAVNNGNTNNRSLEERSRVTPAQRSVGSGGSSRSPDTGKVGYTPVGLADVSCSSLLPSGQNRFFSNCHRVKSCQAKPKRSLSPNCICLLFALQRRWKQP